MSKMVKVMNGTRALGKFTVDQVIRAIRDGEMPDGIIRDDEAYLDALAEALGSLDSDELDRVMEATGCDVAAAEATADQLLSDTKLVQAHPERTRSDVREPRGKDHPWGFSLAHEVFHGAAAAAGHAALTEHWKMVLETKARVTAGYYQECCKALAKAAEANGLGPSAVQIGPSAVQVGLKFLQETTALPAHAYGAVEKLGPLICFSIRHDRRADGD